MSIGVKISKTSKNTSSTDPRDFSLHSDYNSFKVYKEGVTTKLVGPSDVFHIVIPHNLGYIPAFMVFGESLPGDGKRYQTDFVDGIANVNGIAFADTINLYIDLWCGGDVTEDTWHGYYYIFLEPQDTNNESTIIREDYGLRISKETKDVKICAGKDLVFSSEFNTLKDFDRATSSVVVNNGSTVTVTITHGLGYTPAFHVFHEGGDGYIHPADSGGLQFFVNTIYVMCYSYATTTQLIMTFSNTTGSNKTIKYTYFIYKDTV
jgi:hypothetical protein